MNGTSDERPEPDFGAYMGDVDGRFERALAAFRNADPAVVAVRVRRSNATF